MARAAVRFERCAGRGFGDGVREADHFPVGHQFEREFFLLLRFEPAGVPRPDGQSFGLHQPIGLGHAQRALQIDGRPPGLIKIHHGFIIGHVVTL